MSQLIHEEHFFQALWVFSICIFFNDSICFDNYFSFTDSQRKDTKCSTCEESTIKFIYWFYLWIVDDSLEENTRFKLIVFKEGGVRFR